MYVPDGFFRELPNIRTERLLLRRMVARDAADLYTVCSDPRVARYVMWHPHETPGDTRRYVRAIHRSYRANQPSPWAMVRQADGRAIGTMGFVNLHAEHRSAEVGYSLGVPYWNQGYASEALRMVLDFGFAHLGLHRIEAQHDVRNPASGRVMEKVGMRREGELRDRLFNKGEFVTVALYAALSNDAP